MRLNTVFLVCLVFTNLLRAQDAGLSIVIIAGDGTINNINQKVNTEPVIEVRENGKPVEGAAVVFTLPAQGPGGSFSNGSQALTMTTDRLGRATARGIQLNRQTGPFYLRVTASFQGQTANATITETNVSGVSASGGGGFGTKAWVILGIAGAGIAAAVLYATHGGSGTSGPAPIVITPGTPNVGGPH